MVCPPRFSARPCFTSEIDGSSTKPFYIADGIHLSPVSHAEEEFDMVTHDEIDIETAPDMDKLTRNCFWGFRFYSQILTKSNCRAKRKEKEKEKGEF